MFQSAGDLEVSGAREPEVNHSGSDDEEVPGNTKNKYLLRSLKSNQPVKVRVSGAVGGGDDDVLCNDGAGTEMPVFTLNSPPDRHCPGGVYSSSSIHRMVQS